MIYVSNIFVIQNYVKNEAAIIKYLLSNLLPNKLAPKVPNRVSRISPFGSYASLTVLLIPFSKIPETRNLIIFMILSFLNLKLSMLCLDLELVENLITSRLH